jgi:hypothetical protein
VAKGTCQLCALVNGLVLRLLPCIAAAANHVTECLMLDATESARLEASVAHLHHEVLAHVSSLLLCGFTMLKANLFIKQLRTRGTSGAVLQQHNWLLHTAALNIDSIC